MWVSLPVCVELRSVVEEAWDAVLVSLGVPEAEVGV